MPVHGTAWLGCLCRLGGSKRKKSCVHQGCWLQCWKLLPMTESFLQISQLLDCMKCVATETCGAAAPTSHAGEADAPSATPGPACKAGQEVAQELLLQSCRLAGVEWPPGSVLTCAAWTFLAACLPDQPHALGQLLEDVDMENLELVLHGLQYCMEQAPKPPALWPDTLLWYYLLLSAKVCLCCMLAISYCSFALGALALGQCGILSQLCANVSA